MDAREVAAIVKALEFVNAPEERLLDRIFNLAQPTQEGEEEQPKKEDARTAIH